jgi:hypothetical protein
MLESIVYAENGPFKTGQCLGAGEQGCAPPHPAHVRFVARGPKLFAPPGLTQHVVKGTVFHHDHNDGINLVQVGCHGVSLKERKATLTTHEM